MELKQAGFSSATRYDFDRSVAALARVIEARSQETVPVWEDPPKPPSKGQVQVRKPRYTLAELLSDPREDIGLDGDDDEAFADALSSLPTASL